jgi:four helix bundle protein
MAGVTRFEDLLAWQKARQLTRASYAVTSTGGAFQDFGLRNQIQRAAVSVMSNIAEGFDRHKPTEFCHYLSIAKASCAEIRSQLYVALDVGYITESEFLATSNLCLETSRIINGLRTSIKNRQAAGDP